MSRTTRLAMLAVVALAGCGGGSGERTERFDPFTEVRDRTVRSPERASARWERVATLSGSGPASEPFTIDGGAIQWRARWRCDGGRMALSAGSRALAETRCPRAGTSADVGTGRHTLDVEASGRWRVVVEQQVDTPLAEPPLKAMRAPGARVIAAGRFYGLERRGRGTASLYRLRGGRLALRFDGFATSANTDLFVWLSTAPRPRSTVEAARAEHVVLHVLKSTIGAQNYLIPAAVKAAQIRSVVIWCVPVRIAYTAAALRPR
jgi:hypothetical protein